MKCLYYLALVMATQGFVIEDSVRVKRDSDLPKPTLLSITAVDPLGFKLEWRPVSSNDPKNPIIGYRVKIWEVPELITYKYISLSNGEKTLVEEHAPPDIASNQLPDGKPQEFITDKTTLVYSPVKLGVLYEARVEVFTRTQDGPYSEPMRIKLQKEDPNKDVYKTV